MGQSYGIVLYSAVATMLVESCALYAAALIFYIVPFGLGSRVTVISSQALAQFQVHFALPFSAAPQGWNVVI